MRRQAGFRRLQQEVQVVWVRALQGGVSRECIFLIALESNSRSTTQGDVVVLVDCQRSIERRRSRTRVSTVALDVSKSVPRESQPGGVVKERAQGIACLLEAPILVERNRLRKSTGVGRRRGAQRSRNRGSRSTKLQGRLRLSSCSARMPSHPSFTAPFEPGSANR